MHFVSPENTAAPMPSQERCPFIVNHDDHEGTCCRLVEKPGEGPFVCTCSKKATPGSGEASDAYGLPNDLRAAKEEIHEWRSAIEALGVMGGPDTLRKRAVEVLSHHDEHHAREDALRNALANILLVRKEGAIRATAKKLGPDYESDHCAHGGMHITNRVFDEARALLEKEETPFTSATGGTDGK